jgi:hypothetical protein
MRNRTPTRRARDTAEREAIATLRLYVTGCEFCRRNRDTQPHHVCQGSNKAGSVGDVQLILLLCDDCHRAIHRMAGDDARAIALALLEFAGRLNLPLFYERTGRKFPAWELVELWMKRLTGAK